MYMLISYVYTIRNSNKAIKKTKYGVITLQITKYIELYLYRFYICKCYIIIDDGTSLDFRLGGRQI